MTDKERLIHAYGNGLTFKDGNLLTPSQFFSRQPEPNAFQRLRCRLALSRWHSSLLTRKFNRRCLDLVGAGSGLLALSPLLLTTALLIRLESRGPILFRQTRIGLNGEEFVMYKFRSMSTDAEKQRAALEQQNESADGVLFKMKADPRITRVGRIIRRLSIDELPQLLNILKGDMSIVGPRPAIPGEVDQYDMQARKRLQAKPGLTCLWQISGRSELSFSQQVELDIRYLQSRSMTKDLKIIALTVPAVVTGKGAY
ncbi:MAG: sugar transferase [Gammaproteobacteria bacterium]|nr:sugar transferase [Gammaproteobacteria bacterium]